MRRPLVFIAAFYSAGVFLGYYFKFSPRAIIWGAVLILFLLILLFTCLIDFRGKDKRAGVYFLIFILFGILGSFYIQAIEAKTDSLDCCDGSIISIEGRVKSVEEREDYLRVILKPELFISNGHRGHTDSKVIANIYFNTEIQKDIKAQLQSLKLQLAGSKVRLKGRFALPSEMRNPGLFDYKLYLKTRGIGGTLAVQNIHVEISKGKSLAGLLPSQIKWRFSSYLDGYLKPSSKALLGGILFGDKGLMGEEMYEDFRRNGCAHILSVSGIHVNIIYIYISLLFRNRRNPLGSACAIALLLFYAAMAEFSPSVVRAVFMIIIHILSKYLHRRYDLLSSICFSALLMMIYNPFYIFNLGFQLSYLAVLSLAFALPLIESRISKLEEGDAHKWAVKALRIISPIFVIQLAMAPITAFHFFYFSFASFVINIPVIALAGIILPLSVVLILVSICLGDGFFFGLGATAADLLLEIMVGLNEYTGSLSLSSVDVTAPSTLALGMFYGFFFFFFSEEFWRLCRKGDNKKIAGFIICILCLSLCLPTIVGENQRKADIVFVDVGQGDCIHLRTPGGKNVLIDGGGSRDYDIGKKVLLPYMLKNGVKKIDLALVTHLHEDHYGGISSVCRLMTVDKLALYTANIFKENQIKNETGIKEESLVYLAAGDRITVEKDIYIDIIYPKKLSNEEYKELATLENDENLSSLVLKIYFNGTSVLVTGDMGFAGEEYILKEYGGDKNDILKSDILKVGHHGSKYSTSNAFLESVRPQAAVIQVGKNNFGHPHGDVIEKLAEKDIMIYRNDEDGAVLINIKRDSVRINSML